jgi:putative membrane protein
MKRAGILVVAFATAMTIGTAAQAQSPAGGGQAGQPPSGAPGPGGTEPSRMPPQGSLDTGAAGHHDARQFFEKAAISNMAEIQLSQMAADHSQNAEVKQFAQTMVDEHTKALEQLKQAASAANVTLPTDLDKKHQKAKDKLSKLNGAAFDKEYMNAMVDDHKDAAKLLKSESKQSAAAPVGTTGAAGGTASAGAANAGTASTGTAGESETAMNQAREWAAQTLPTVEQHLDHAKQIQDSIKNAGRSNGSNSGSAPTGSNPGGTSNPNGSGSGSGSSSTPPRS